MFESLNLIFFEIKQIFFHLNFVISVAHRRRVLHQAEKNYFDGDLLDKTIMKLYLNNIFHHN